MLQFLGNPLLGIRNPRLELHCRIPIAEFADVFQIAAENYYRINCVQET